MLYLAPEIVYIVGICRISMNKHSIKEEIKKVYYCDISYESYDNEQLKMLNIDSIPILFKFKNGVMLQI